MTSATRGQLWADKYRPQTIAQMCYPVSANKLKAWVANFEPAGVGDVKRPRGALLSGPPGVGKTTTVHVVARELNMEVVEYNASDFRSRKSLHEHVSTLTTNRAVSSTHHHRYTNVILLMDEVDGCDIGGVGEVIEMIKKTSIPILCTCNDRWHPKLRSLINYVEDVRFSRPPCNIVATYLYDQVLAREGITLSKPLLQDIIKRSGSDIRNMLNNLQLWCVNRNTLEQRELAECSVQSSKNGDAGLFESAEYFLLQGTSRGAHHTIEEMQACYYNSDLVDMFVQENYLHYNPSQDGRDWMEAVVQASADISRSDAAQRIMYYEQNWSVSRAHVLLSSIAPCIYVRGKYESFATGQQVFFDRQRPVKFPSWLGNNSTANKNTRLLRCITVQATHPIKGISGHQQDVVLDYLPLGWERSLTHPLVEKGKDGIADVIGFMDVYGLMRDDWELVQTLPHYKHMTQHNTLSMTSGDIATAVKSAFTREFNKTHRMERLAKGTLRNGGEMSTVGGEEEEEAEDGSVTVKKKAAPAATVAKTKRAPAKPRAKKEPGAAPAAGGRRKAAKRVRVDSDVESDDD